MYDVEMFSVLVTAFENNNCIPWLYEIHVGKGKGTVEIGARVEVSQLVDSQGE
jgi:hypothetical protein